jgi:hypothetical protein
MRDVTILERALLSDELNRIKRELMGLRRELHSYYESLLLRTGKLRIEKELAAEERRRKKLRARLPLKGKV